VVTERDGARYRQTVRLIFRPREESTFRSYRDRVTFDVEAPGWLAEWCRLRRESGNRQRHSRGRRILLSVQAASLTCHGYCVQIAIPPDGRRSHVPSNSRSVPQSRHPPRAGPPQLRLGTEGSTVIRKHDCVLAAITIVAAQFCQSCSGPNQPTTESLGGTWSGTSTLVTVTNGDCYGLTLRESIGLPGEFVPIVISQTGNMISTTLTSEVFGARCNYSGEIVNGSFSASAQVCAGFTLFCPGGTIARDFRFVAGSFSGHVTANRATGTVVETWRLIDTSTGIVVGDLAESSNLAMTRR